MCWAGAQLILLDAPSDEGSSLATGYVGGDRVLEAAAALSPAASWLAKMKLLHRKHYASACLSTVCCTLCSHAGRLMRSTSQRHGRDNQTLIQDGLATGAAARHHRRNGSTNKTADPLKLQVLLMLQLALVHIALEAGLDKSAVEGTHLEPDEVKADLIADILQENKL